MAHLGLHKGELHGIKKAIAERYFSSHGVPDATCHGCGGESGGNRALYAAQRHLIARFAEREESFDVLNELEV